MLTAPRPRRPRKRRWLLRGLFLALALYLAAALLPCAFPPRLDAAGDTAWMAAEASDPNANRARLLTTGQEALETRLALIASARESIDLGTYIFAPDASGRRVAAALLAAADRGVRVRILTDGLIGWINLGRDPLGPALGAHPNIELKFYNPVDPARPWGLNARYHEKFLLVDATWLVLGGRNISDEFLSEAADPRYNYDQDVLLYRTDPTLRDAAAQMQAYFSALWAGPYTALRYDAPAAAEQPAVAACQGELCRLWAELTAAGPLALPDPWQDMVAVERTLLLTNPVEPVPSAPVLWSRLCQLMATARERLWIVTPYLVMDGAMNRDLAQVCAAAPADTRLLVNSRQAGNNIIASADYTIHRPMAQRLGAALWEFQGDRSMHTKTLLIDDDLSLIGSFNLDPRSAYLDTELMLAVYSPGLNAQLEANLCTLWAQSLAVSPAGDYLPGAVEAQSASFWKMAAITLLSPLVALVRYLV